MYDDIPDNLIDELFDYDFRTFDARFLDNETKEEIPFDFFKIVINSGSCGSEEFAVGGTYSSYIEVEGNTESIIEGRELSLQIGFQAGIDFEYIPMGIFKALKPTREVGKITFQAVDRMTSSLSGLYVSKLKYPAKIESVVAEISNMTGITINWGRGTIGRVFDYATIDKKIENVTYREAIGIVASLFFGYAYCDREGNIEIDTFKSYTLKNSSIFNVDADILLQEPQIHEYNYTINSAICIVRESGTDDDGNDITEIKYSKGNGFGVTISNPYMTKPFFDYNVEYSILGLDYRPGNIEFLGNPLLDPVDAIAVTDIDGNVYKIPCMNIVQTYDGGLTTTITAPGETEESDSVDSTGPLTKLIEKQTAEIMLAKQMITNRLTADEADIKYATIQKTTIIEADIEKVTGDFASFKTGEFESLKSKQADFETTTTENFRATNAELEKVTGDFAAFKTGEFESLKSKQADFETTTTENFRATNAELEKATGDFASFKTGEFEDLKAKSSELETAVIGKADITDLDALRTRTGTLEADFSKISTLVNGNLTSENIQNLNLTSLNTTIENGMIKNAMIESLMFDKITGIDINTTKMTVHSDDGKSTWTDNTIQIADTKRVRVQIGKDAEGDYNIYIWDKDGNLMFDPLYGIQESGIKRAIIRDDMISDNANIQGSKLDIEDVIKEVNGAETVIKGTRIRLDEQNQTLDMAFSALKTYAEGVNSKTETNTTAITVAQGQISSLISNTTIIKDGKTVQLKDAYNSTVSDINTMKTTIGEHTSLLDEQSGEILAVQTKANTIESDLNGTKQTISDVQSDLSGTKSRVTAVESGLDGLKTRVSDTETALTKKADGTTVDTLTDRVATCETTLDGFEVSLSETNKTVSDNYTSLANEIEETNATVATHTEQISKHDTRITAAENSISLKVSTSDFNSYKTTVTGDIDTAKNAAINAAASDATTKANNAKSSAINTAAADAKTKADKALADSKSYTNAQVATVNESLSETNQEINVMKGQIALKVEQTDIETAVQNIEVGGRNIINNSGNFTVLGKWEKSGASGIEIVQKDGHPCIHATDGSIVQKNEYRLEWDTEYVYHCMVKFSVKGNISSASPLHFWLFKSNVVNYINASNGAGSSSIMNENISFDANEWVHIRLKIKTIAKPDDYEYVLFRPIFYGSIIADGMEYWIRWIKLEKGNKATDWTPAPEDIDSSITAVNNKFTSYSTTAQMNSAIQAKADSITQSVSATYATKSDLTSNVNTLKASLELKVNKDKLISEINASADVITLTGNRFIVNSDNFSLTADGTMTANNGIFSGSLNGATGSFSGDITANGSLETKRDVTIAGRTYTEITSMKSGIFEHVGYLNPGAVNPTVEDDTKFDLTIDNDSLAIKCSNIQNSSNYQKLLIGYYNQSNGLVGSGKVFGINYENMVRDIEITGYSYALREFNDKHDGYTWSFITRNGTSSSAIVNSNTIEYNGYNTITSSFYTVIDQSAKITGNLTVSGDYGITFDGSGDVRCNGEHGLYSTTMGKYIVRYYIANSTKCIALGNNNYATRIYGSSVWANASISTSDERLKTEFKSLDNMIDVFMELEPVSFRWKQSYEDGDSLVHFGLKAQQVRQVFEKYGYNTENYSVIGDFGDQLGICYNDVAMMTMCATQKNTKELMYQAGKIDLHETIIQDLQNQVYQLQKQLKELKQAVV